MAPRLRIARSAIDHSGLFSDSSAIRSPGFIPNSARPSATLRTRSTKVSAEILIHSLPILWLSASCFPCFAAAVRQRPGTDEAFVASRSLLFSIFAEAVEAKCVDSSRSVISETQLLITHLDDITRRECQVSWLKQFAGGPSARSCGRF